MATSPDHARELARRIASRLEGGPSDRSSVAPGDIAGLRAMLTEVGQRLDRIESQLGRGSNTVAPTAAYSPWTPPELTHASQDRFNVEEATVAEMVDYFEQTKKCELEPGGKPCDHCSMCSSRGF
jgi:hypothetical protein